MSKEWQPPAGQAQEQVAYFGRTFTMRDMHAEKDSPERVTMMIWANFLFSPELAMHYDIDRRQVAVVDKVNVEVIADILVQDNGDTHPRTTISWLDGFGGHDPNLPA